jgi:lipoprotein-anchoring transpeptidase ErfK/SrfK
MRKQPQRLRKLKLVAVKFILLVLAVSLVAYGAIHVLKTTKTTQSTNPSSSQSNTAVSNKTAPSNACSSNQLPQLVLVSISQRHMWACNSSTQVYDSAVITGMENLPADLTPTGTYHIYTKLTNQVLKGCDTTGCWNDPVSYWLPFLDNQYGTYGFHDATWRAPTDFGNISPYSSNASHGCVEMPLAASRWLYNWSNIGTTITINT